ncbi:UNVERIFIED_ORG: hypothetical protein J2Y77_003533 [Pseudomonas lini]|uniref:Uncharacterized protein n=1 Tax=Pseudomonas viciae TaxID=2505979 RepID=A0A4P7PLV9_9PSED|nr:hypothetical protein [Pseudomonas viciae]QBZ91482.1 hypothetical protein EPZ47_23205 [Pseudomonas viciae]UZE85303.1 hypothetical protein LOY66_22435 [Pseudomonas viciae]WGO92260.1 hypothetical protein QCD61_21515 [Pseudomonas viciae]
MNKPLKTITNPMTLIAIFATLSETSAAISLPFLDDQDREYYLWFLISFPFYLLLLFFITLNFNYRSLYSPSDFRKSKHFIKTMDDSTCRHRRVLRRADKVKKSVMRGHRRKHDPQRFIFLLFSPSGELIAVYRAKPLKPATGHTEIVLYVMHSRDNADGVPDRQEG